MIVTVCAVGCMYSSVATAAQRVPVRSTIVVRGNAHGGVMVDRPLTIRGEGGATMSGGISGIVVRAPHVLVEHLRFTGYAHDDPSGRSAAIVLVAPDGIVRDNQFQGNAFAITAARADRAIIENNRIDGGDDAIRLWYTPDAVVAGNTISSGRDVLISYSPRVTFAGNDVRGCRYGLHDMFSDGMRVLRNTFENNEIGANFMYAAHLDVHGNTFRMNRGAAGYGIGFEDVDSSNVRVNRFIGNRVAMSSIDSPADPHHADDIEANLFAQNGSALSLQSDPHALRVTGNAFVDNLEDVEVSGGGTAAGVAWTKNGRGNYWSAYAGYDRNNDGVGDIPYAPQPAFDALTDTHPELQMFRYSPAALALQFAARALPATAGAPKLTDSAPLLAPPQAALAAAPARGVNPIASLLALLSAVPIALVRRTKRTRARVRAATSQTQHALAIEAMGVRKMYARERGVREITFTVRAGESVALWGPNGAGKSTFFRCILGEKLDAGALRVFNRVPSPNDRAARAYIGYAPQHLPDFDARVGEVAELVAALRGASALDVERVLALVRLGSERARFVNELSGGMRQRLSVALALIGDPPLLLLDEPTAGLDRQSRDAVVAILNAERARGKTLLLSSHVLEDVHALADRVIMIEDGSVTDDSRTAAVSQPC